jgi:hypothetical protein
MAGSVRMWRGRMRIESGVNGAYWIFVGLLVVQILHMVEHTAQVHQYFLGVQPARGFLGAWFDFVWVHFAFNTVVFLTVLTAWWLWRRGGDGWRHNKRGARWFMALIVFQAYHALEHVAQMVQYYSGTDPPPGLIGHLLPNPIAHFDLNLILLVLISCVFVTLRPRRMPVVLVPDAHASARASA